MFKKIVVLLLIFSVISFAWELEPKGNLKGKVIDKETLLPLIGVNIFLKSTTIGTSTDANGDYSFENLPVGTYTVTYSYIGYESATKTDVIVRSKRTTFENVSLHISTVEMESVVVESGYFSEIENKPISTINFSNEEIRRAPGSAGDVSRILFGLPSLAKVNDQRNSLIVRGGSPVENSFYLDNIEIPNINHFPVQGSSDGPIGLINPEFIKDVNFHSGGFSTIYGNRLSSIMELSYRDGNKDHFGTQINVSLQGMGGAIEGPIGNKGSYLFSANKSYLDLIIDVEETGGAMPNYSDAQGKLVYNIDDKNKITLLDVFSIDQINLEYENAIKTNSTNVYGSTNGYTNTVGLNWQNIWNKAGYSNTSLSYQLTDYDRDYYETKSQNRLLRNLSKENRIKLRNVNYYKINKTSSIEFGAEGTLFFNDFDLSYGSWQDKYGNITPELRIKENFNNIKASVFGMHHFQLTNAIKLNYGLRLDYFTYNSELNIAPRFSLEYKFNEKTTATASAGMFYQNIPNNILVQNNAFKNLKTPTANHYIVGISRMLGESTRLSVEAYYKDYSNFPIDPAQPHDFLFDQVVSTGLFLNHANLIDNGTASSKGIEVMIQKKLARDFYGLVAGSISKSRYQDMFGDTYDRIYDNQFNFTLEGGYIPNNNWEFKARWIYAGGAPYTPFDYEASKENNKGIIDTDRMNSERLPDYHSLNIR
ncbi:MAG: TonB-dependent receptor, partial [Melioribacteraceae bacterium]|nr:TonB-dependent receptor [Melioribacteraceae bacterium]